MPHEPFNNEEEFVAFLRELYADLDTGTQQMLHVIDITDHENFDSITTEALALTEQITLLLQPRRGGAKFLAAMALALALTQDCIHAVSGRPS